MNRSSCCRGCKSPKMRFLLDFGLQPICSHFLMSENSREEMFPLSLGQCATCGLIQLGQAAPVEALRPRYDWIRYNEPERHLDDAVARVVAQTKLSPASRILGISYKDETTLERMRRSGYTRSRILDPASDLNIRESGAGIETIQDQMTPERTHKIVAQHGQADLVVVRHILEHAHTLHAFAEALRILTHPDGFIVFEVPDFTPALDNHDYASIWEEHILYFTPSTFVRTLYGLGFEVLELLNYPYCAENSLVVVARPGAAQSSSQATPEDFEKADAYRKAFLPRCAQLDAYLAALCSEQRKTGVFGAGHLAAKFINLHGVGGHVSCVIDDHPHKQGLFMPGSHLPIVGSTALRPTHIPLCLMALSPESEARVVARHEAYITSGGRMVSIFAASPRGLRLN